MKSKARQNQKAALMLLEAGLVDAAATRFYYALFQAVAHALLRAGRAPADFRPGARRWDHRILGEHAPLVRGRGEDALLWRTMRDIRNKADYEPEPVPHGPLELRKHEIIRFVQEATA